MYTICSPSSEVICWFGPVCVHYSRGNKSLAKSFVRIPLNSFFGCQQQQGKMNENPTVREFCQNTQDLRVVNSMCQNVSCRNCNRKRKLTDVGTEILKRRRPHKVFWNIISLSTVRCVTTNSVSLYFVCECACVCVFQKLCRNQVGGRETDWW